MTTSTKRKRSRPAKPITAVESVGLSIAPKMLAELDRHAKYLGVSRSALIRFFLNMPLDSVRRHGRPWLKERYERRRANEPTAETEHAGPGVHAIESRERKESTPHAKPD